MITKEISNVEKRAAFKMNKTITEQISPQNNQHIKRKAAEIHHLLSVILEKKNNKGICIHTSKSHTKPSIRINRSKKHDQ